MKLNKFYNQNINVSLENFFSYYDVLDNFQVINNLDSIKEFCNFILDSIKLQPTNINIKLQLKFELLLCILEVLEKSEEMKNEKFICKIN